MTFAGKIGPILPPFSRCWSFTGNIGPSYPAFCRLPADIGLADFFHRQHWAEFAGVLLFFRRYRLSRWLSPATLGRVSRRFAVLSPTSAEPMVFTGNIGPSMPSFCRASADIGGADGLSTMLELSCLPSDSYTCPVENVLLRRGAPKVLVTDRGTAFTAELTQTILK